MSKLRLRNGDDVFLMVEYELNNKLFVKILNLKRYEVYVGHSNDIELRSQAARIRLTFDEFIEKIIKALIENATDNSNFLYCLDEKDGIYKFQWKSIDEEQTIVSLGSVDVRKESFVITLADMLENISIDMHLMRNKIQDLNADIDKTRNQTSDALGQLRLATEMKETLEREMYSKFVLVLNEKKRKIRELQQKNKHTSLSSYSEYQKKKPKKSSKPLVNDTSNDTDEFEDIDKPGPSNTKTDTSFSFLDDNKSILPANRNRIRNRKILESSKESKNNSTFANSNQSSKNIIEDDVSDEHLFDDL
ncbi:unnamed protein product [Larinioides sclopetarius]|uniref:SpoVT-AbrB domain-containing protein n=1 Tax=Larinioides sclopetarius TaxID=280406 RepID=A0AAV1Z368_9ARAC